MLSKEQGVVGGQGQGTFLPSPLYQVSCRLLGCGSANIRLGSHDVQGKSAYRAVPLLGDRRTCRSGVNPL